MLLMRYLTNDWFYEYDGQLWRLIKKHCPYDTKSLKRIFIQLFSMLDYHSKVHVIRFDLHQQSHTADNKRITEFNRKLFKWIKKKYGFSRIGYAWTRELETGKGQHYHYALFLDGHKIQHPQKIIDRASQTWELMGGHFAYVPNCYYNLARSDRKALQAVIYRLSYFAKDKSKQKRPATAKRNDASRLKRKDS